VLWGTTGGDFVITASATTAVGTSTGRKNISGGTLVSDVQNWLDNPGTNFGWALIGTETVSSTARGYASRENATVANRPTLNVSFTLPAPSFCDDSDGSLASCPCSNPGDPDTGCDLAQGTGGVGLSLVAQETSPQNRITMQGTGFPPMSAPSSIMIRATTLDPSPPFVFGDGLRCINSTVVRLAATFASGGQATHTAGHGAMAGSGDFYYQLWFRNTPGMFCTPAAFNLSNGRILSW
jgi:hypothetical protein